MTQVDTRINNNMSAAPGRDNMDGADDSSNNGPRDETLTTCLFFEPQVQSGNISIPGLYFIANHKYRPSDYTHLDNLLKHRRSKKISCCLLMSLILLFILII